MKGREGEGAGLVFERGPEKKSEEWECSKSTSSARGGDEVTMAARDSMNFR